MQRLKQIDSLAITAVRGIYEFSGPRAITQADAAYVVELALRPCCQDAIAPVHMHWFVDNAAVDTPIGRRGSRLTVQLEVLLARLRPAISHPGDGQ